jgi:hypothetical protein
MDATSHQHERFRSLVDDLVLERRRLFQADAATDWVVACYDSVAAFQQRFPNSSEYEKWIQNAEQEDLDRNADLSFELNRLLRDGFTYEDLESLRYDFP